MSEFTPEKVFRWLDARRDNALRISRLKHGDDRKGWEEDAQYLYAALALIARLRQSEAANVELRTVIEKLPKTADGVPVVPGMKLLYPGMEMYKLVVVAVEQPITNMQPAMFDLEVLCENATRNERIAAWRCYSTDAALAKAPTSNQKGA